MQFFGFILFIIIAIAQFVAGFVGIEEHFGTVWACVAIGVAFIFRFTLPITIGAFFGAMDVWDWHWAAALLFTLPGLIFLVPGIIASVIDGVRK